MESKYKNDEKLEILILDYIAGIFKVEEIEKGKVVNLNDLLNITADANNSSKLLQEYLTDKYHLEFTNCNSNGSKLVVELCEYFICQWTCNNYKLKQDG